MEENDDTLIGQILSRRDALKLLGIGSAAFLAACVSPEESSTSVPTAGSTQVLSTQSVPTAGAALDCVVRPEMTIGPYFVDQQLNRPIIAITALAMPGDREQCIQAGATEYLSKPINLKMLKKMIMKQTRQQTEP